MKSCPFCKEEIENDARQCPHCRSALDEASAATVAKAPDRAGITGWVLLPALALAVQVYSVFKKLILEPQELRSRGYTVSFRMPPLVADLILLALVLLTAFFFFRRRRLAPPLFIVLVMAAFLAWVVVIGLSPSFGDEPIIGVFSMCWSSRLTSSGRNAWPPPSPCRSIRPTRWIDCCGRWKNRCWVSFLFCSAGENGCLFS